jgi:ribosomal protein S18 acetylase RimI-like enzyme
VIEIRHLTPDDWPVFRAMRRAALREAPAAFGSTLASWSGDGDTQDRWRARLSTVPHNAFALVDGIPAGMASGTIPDADGRVELISMWVAPPARGRGVGEALVADIAAFATPAPLVLRVYATNARALSLYRRVGFLQIGTEADELVFLRPSRG